MACTGAYANAQDWANEWCASIDDTCEAALNQFLRRSAAQIHMAMQASGQCDCTLSTAAAEFLRQLNLIIGAALYRCPCAKPAMNLEERKFYAEQARFMLEQIRTGQLELCAGETAADFPVVGWAEQGMTEFAQARIIINAELRNS